MRGDQSWGSIKRNKALKRQVGLEFAVEVIIATGIFALAIFI